MVDPPAVLVKNRPTARGPTALPYATPPSTNYPPYLYLRKVLNSAANLLVKSSPLSRTQPHYPKPVIHNIPNYTYLLCYANLYVPFNTALGHTHTNPTHSITNNVQPLRQYTRLRQINDSSSRNDP